MTKAKAKKVKRKPAPSHWCEHAQPLADRLRQIAEIIEELPPHLMHGTIGRIHQLAKGTK